MSDRRLRDRYCWRTDKRRYRSKRLALLENADLPLLSAYHCDFCRSWHITRRADVSDLAHDVAEAA